MTEYLTVLDKAAGEYTEKRSKFVSTLCHVETEAEASEILSAVRSEHFGANHNVYAYVLKDGTARFSDDSEPHGTAGKPVLDVIEGNKLKDVIIVVTRYFGGVLLGTGGLVRSYTTAAKDAVNNAEIVKMCECAVLSVTCEYSDYEKLIKLIKDSGSTAEESDFGEKVYVKFKLLSSEKEMFVSSLTEAFSSRLSAKCEEIGIFPLKIQNV